MACSVPTVIGVERGMMVLGLGTCTPRAETFFFALSVATGESA